MGSVTVSTANGQLSLEASAECNGTTWNVTATGNNSTYIKASSNTKDFLDQIYTSSKNQTSPFEFNSNCSNVTSSFSYYQLDNGYPETATLLNLSTNTNVIGALEILNQYKSQTICSGSEWSMTNPNNQLRLYFASDGSLKELKVSNSNSKSSCLVCNSETSCEPYNLGLSNSYYIYEYSTLGSNSLGNFNLYFANEKFNQILICSTTLTKNGDIELKEDKCLNYESSESYVKIFN